MNIVDTKTCKVELIISENESNERPDGESFEMIFWNGEKKLFYFGVLDPFNHYSIEDWTQVLIALKEHRSAKITSRNLECCFEPETVRLWFFYSPDDEARFSFDMYVPLEPFRNSLIQCFEKIVQTPSLRHN